MIVASADAGVVSVSSRILGVAGKTSHTVEAIVSQRITGRCFVSALLALVFLAGCASNSKKTGIRSQYVGAYRFTERTGDDAELNGTFVVETDTVSIEATPGPCRYEKERSNALAFVYTCGDVTYVFDRTDPVRRASYSTMVRIQKTRSVCVRYTVTPQGQSVCAQYRSEVYYVDARRSGSLNPQRIADDDLNHPDTR